MRTTDGGRFGTAHRRSIFFCALLNDGHGRFGQARGGVRFNDAHLTAETRAGTTPGRESAK